MSAFENVELPMTVLGKLSKKEAKARAIELLTRKNVVFERILTIYSCWLARSFRSLAF